jgi:amino acid adenylation domain-containing protein
VLASAAPRVVLTDAGVADAAGIPTGGTAAAILLDRDWTAVADLPADRPHRTVAPEGLAYVIFTSGSTGEPKGVMLTHRGLVNHNLAVAALYRLAPGDRVLQFCSLGFDVSIEEILPTLETGATLVLRPDQAPVLGRSWLDWLRESRVTVLNLPTAYWHEWVGDLRHHGQPVPDCVRLVIVGGEKALGPAYRQWRGLTGERVRWLNAYGPAECSVLSTYYEPPAAAPAAEGDPPIGRPLPNTWVEILDDDGNGGGGEMLIGGAGLARGYLGRPDLTAESFVRDAAGARVYRTGDIGLVLEDGDLAFVGRIDEQVKVRGFRVEPGEVASALARHPEVAEVAVVGREDEPGEKRLVAYFVASDAARVPTIGELRRFLAGLVPRYMVPGAFVALEALPLTPGGKLARGSLPAPSYERDRPASDPSTVTTEAEREIAGIFAVVLGIAGVGPGDDFFDLGGHSLQGMQVVAAIRDQLGVSVEVRSLLECPTVRELAHAVQGARSANDAPPPLVAGRRHPGDRIPLTLSQEHMWRLESQADPGLFNVTAQARFDAPVDRDALQAALDHVVARHDALRACIGSGARGAFQTVSGRVSVPLAESDLRGAEDLDAELRRRLAAQDAQPFDLARPPLLRAALYRLQADRAVAAATFDHLICDGTSAYIFLGEWTAAYDALAAGSRPALRALPIQYPDFAIWQRRWVTEERLGEQLEYWKRTLADVPLGPALPFDHVPEHPTRRIASVPVALSSELYASTRRLARVTGTTVFVVMVAAVQALLGNARESSEFVLSTTLSGRRRVEVERLIGCFHGIGRLRTDLSGDPSFAVTIGRARETVLGLLEHQDIPFSRVRQAVLGELPKARAALLAAAPTELQYFHTAHDEWAPGVGLVERPGPDKGRYELFFRGHLHPLVITFLDDGDRLWGELSYKVDFYQRETIERLAGTLPELLDAVTRDPNVRLTELRHLDGPNRGGA